MQKKIIKMAPFLGKKMSISLSLSLSRFESGRDERKGRKKGEGEEGDDLLALRGEEGHEGKGIREAVERKETGDTPAGREDRDRSMP